MPFNSSDDNINRSIKKVDRYFKSALSMDCVIFGYDKETEELLLLTLESDIPPYRGLHCLVGDLVQFYENLDDAATRVLRERRGSTMYSSIKSGPWGGRSPSGGSGRNGCLLCSGANRFHQIEYR